MILILSVSSLSQQLFLNIYVDDTSANKALVVGNVDDVFGLPFLNASDQIHRITASFIVLRFSPEERRFRLEIELPGQRPF